MSSQHRNIQVARIREEGRIAAREGKPITACPYRLRTECLNRMQWRRGYKEELPEGGFKTEYLADQGSQSSRYRKFHDLPPLDDTPVGEMARRSALEKKLRHAMPEDKAEKNSISSQTATVAMLSRPLSLDPIRRAADNFAAYLDADIPLTNGELRDVLYVFGKVLDGEMERLLEVQRKLVMEMNRVALTPLTIAVDKEGK